MIKKNNFWLYFSIGLVTGALSSIVFILLIYAYTEPTKITKFGDAISIANTYIVLVTLLFVIWTIAITIYTIWFSKWFSKEQTKEIKDNIKYISKTLKQDAQTRDWFIIEIIKNDEFEIHLNEKLDEIIDRIIRDKLNEHVKLNFELKPKKDTNEKYNS